MLSFYHLCMRGILKILLCRHEAIYAISLQFFLHFARHSSADSAVVGLSIFISLRGEWGFGRPTRFCDCLVAPFTVASFRLKLTGKNK